MVYSEGQKSWGWLIAIYVFLAGVGGGTFLFSFILNFLGIYQSIARIGVLVSPLLVLLGTFLLLFDLGSITKAYRMFTTPSTLLASWMVRGAWILTAFIICGLAYALPSLRFFEWLPWSQASGLGQGIGIAAALLSILVVAYPGFLFGVIESIPFWNTSALPPLFLLSGLDTGISVIVLIALSLPASLGIEGFHLLGTADIVLIILLLIVLGAYIEIVRQAGVTASASVHLLKTPMFIGGVIILGLLLPLVLLVISMFVSDVIVLRTLAGVNGLLILAGGIFLRYSVIRAGVRITIR
ncbi:NrfD/PsrC family molybdoenzyme membrane anchor subunit [Chloroflexota bacterium]